MIKSAPSVLHFFILFFRFSDESVLLLIQDSVDELLLCLDVRQIDPSFIWPVLRALAQSCEEWQSSSGTATTSSLAAPSSSSERGTLTEVTREESVPSHVTESVRQVTNSDAATSHVTDHVTPEAVEEFFLQYHREKRRREEERFADLSDSELYESENEQDIDREGENAEGENPYDQREELSPLHRTVVELMHRCGHHMSVECPSLRLIVLDTLTHCLLALKHQQVCHSYVSFSDRRPRTILLTFCRLLFFPKFTIFGHHFSPVSLTHPLPSQGGRGMS